MRRWHPITTRDCHRRRSRLRGIWSVNKLSELRHKPKQRTEVWKIWNMMNLFKIWLKTYKTQNRWKIKHLNLPIRKSKIWWINLTSRWSWIRCRTKLWICWRRWWEIKTFWTRSKLLSQAHSSCRTTKLKNHFWKITWAELPYNIIIIWTQRKKIITKTLMHIKTSQRIIQT